MLRPEAALEEPAVALAPHAQMMAMEAGAGADGVGGRAAGASAALEAGRRLLLAARAGDTAAVRALLAAGAPFTADWLGTSPLHLAAANDHLETVEVLLRAGVSRDARTKVERTPLHLAASAGHDAVVSLLLGYGANVDCRDMLGMTPLHWAAERGHAAAARVLLAGGADAGALSKFRKTPLALAARSPALRALFDAELAARARRDQHPAQHQQQPKQYKAQKLPKEQATEQLTNISFETAKIQKTPEKKPIKVKLVNSPKCEPKISSKTETGTGAGGEAAALLLQRHGITLLPHDTGSTVLSALQCGRTVVLSDAGKLMLKESSSPATLPAESAAAAAPLGQPPAPAPAPTKVLKKLDPVQFQKVKLMAMSEGGAAPLKPLRLRLRTRAAAAAPAPAPAVRLLLQRAPAPAPAQPQIQAKSSSEEESGLANEVATLRAQLAAARATIAELRRQLAARPAAPTSL